MVGYVWGASTEGGGGGMVWGTSAGALYRGAGMGGLVWGAWGAWYRGSGMENCRALCSEKRFFRLRLRLHPFPAQIQGGLHIHWEKPELNRQNFQANLSLAL